MPSNVVSPCQPRRLAQADMRWAWPALFLIVATLLFFRQPDAIRHPFFLAEDGNIFFKQFYESGFVATFFVRYAGYLHCVSRISAALAGFFPLECAPTAYSVMSLAIAASTLTFFFSPGFRPVIESDFIRAVVVMIAVCMPNDESIMRLCYSDWNLLFFVALITVYELPRGTIARGFLFLPVALAIWSAPLIIVCLPLIFLRTWQATKPGERLWWGVVAATLLAYSLTAEHATSLFTKALTQPGVFTALVHAVGYRVFCFFFFGAEMTRQFPVIGWPAVTCLSLLLAGACVAGVWLASTSQRSCGSSRQAPLILLYLVLAAPVLFIMRLEIVPDFLVWNDRTWGWHHRYFYAPELFLCVLGGIIYERRIRDLISRNAGKKLLASALFLGWLRLHTAQYRVGEWRSSASWRHYARLIHAAERRVQTTDGIETVRVFTCVPVFDFDLAINRETAARDRSYFDSSLNPERPDKLAP